MSGGHHGGGHESGGGGGGAELIKTPDSNSALGLIAVAFMMLAGAVAEFFNQVVGRTL